MSTVASAGRLLPRVAITGMGVVSAIGIGLPRFRASLHGCHSGVAERELFDETWSDTQGRQPIRHLAAEIRDFRENGQFRDVPPASLDLFAKFAVTAADEAIRDAGADLIRENRHRTAVVLGTAVGGDQSRDATSYRLYSRRQSPHPLTIVRVMVNAAVSAVSMVFGLTGPAFSVSSACASSAHAIGEACRMLQFGLADVAIAGGAESLPSYGLYRSWRQMKVLSPDGCRPFAMDRNGIVLGEGAGVVVLEPLERALARGAHVYAEIAGFGMSADAVDWVNPDPVGMVRCMTAAMEEAGVGAGELAYVNAHAPGTVRGDAAEAEAMARVLGPETARIPVSSTKALHGHALGASGAIELIATALAVDERRVPPMPYTAYDPRFPLHFANAAAPMGERPAAMSNSFGFGGLNATIVLRRA